MRLFLLKKVMWCSRYCAGLASLCILLFCILIVGCTCDNTKRIGLSLSQIKVEATNDTIEEFELVHHMFRILKSANHSYTHVLKIRIEDSTLPLAMNNKSDILRQMIARVLYYELHDISDDRIITSGKVKVFSSYSTSIESIASYAQRSKNSIELLKNGGNEIKMRLEQLL